MASPHVNTGGWKGESNRRSTGNRDQHSPNHRIYAKTSQSPNNSSQNGPTPHQLSNIKRQWNVQRDIPSGTVKNNPFVPKTEPGPGPPPQLLHQKKQWDTSTIQRGSVAARASSMEAEVAPMSSPNSKMSPQMQQNRSKFERQAGTPRRNSPIGGAVAKGTSPVSYARLSPKTNKKAFTFDHVPQQAGHEPAIPTVHAPTSLRGRMIENPLMSKTAATAPYQGGKWEPSKEIPAGAVKGRVNKFVVAAEPTAQASQPNHHVLTSHRKHQQQKYREDMSEDDPWIIPNKSGSTPVNVDNWGQALASKSAESDGWDAPDVDWVKSSDSTKVSLEKNAYSPDHQAEMGVFDEKKVDDEDSLKGRESNILLAQQKKKTQQEVEMFETAHERENDILQAAKKKISIKNKSPAFEVFEPNANSLAAFPGEVAKAFEAFEAFASSPFGGENHFGNFPNRGSRNPMETSNFSDKPKHDDLFHDAKRGKERPVPQYNPQSYQKQVASVELVDSYDEPTKKDKKGFFGKLFGGRKSRQSTDSKQRESLLQNKVSVATDRESLILSPDAASAQVRQSRSSSLKAATSPEKSFLASPISHEQREDDTTISEMTIPTIFNEVKKYPWEPQDPAVSKMETVPSSEEDDVATAGSASSIDGGVLRPTGIAISGNESEKEDIDHKESQIPSFESHVNYSQPPPPPPPPRHGDMDNTKKLIVNLVDVPSREAGMGSAFDAERLNRKVKEFKKKSSSRLSLQSPGTPVKDQYSLKHASKGSEKVLSSTHDAKFSNNKMVKFPQAARAYQQVGKPYLMSTGLSNQSTEPATNYDMKGALSQESSNTPSQRSYESSSVESDIRVLRTILRRPRKGRDLRPVARPKQVFATYNNDSIMDPMQRAGLRLLSAAVIPIQTEVRRFLAMRRALTRMWALIVIQSHTRRHLARKQYVKDLKSIVRVQALARGNIERNELIYRHICAIEVQRHVRGYLSTMRVYEEIYKVTMVQSFVRMKLAMEEATNRMALVIQLQSVSRGFLVRQRLEREHACATAIQANLRCFLTRLTYQFDLLDIIIVQSVWRRKTAIDEARNRRRMLENRAATMIQTKWRSYDATMNYLHFLADVLICQSTSRRFLVVSRVKKERQAAVRIQSIWRGFVSYADYMFSVADIVSVQKTARRWLSLRKVRSLREERKRENAALAIQKCWRGFVAETEYVVMKYEHYAARTIQTSWRRFWNFSNYVIALDCTIQIQRAHRAHRQRTLMKRLNAVSKIQRAYRAYLQRKLIKTLNDASENQAELESKAALHIQAYFRGMQARVAVKAYTAARRIQSHVRGHQARTAVSFYYAARKIQAMWRCKRLYSAYTFYRSALLIQTMWRGMRGRREALVLRGEYLAASLIQSAWRGFVCYTDYIFTISDIIAAQKVARRYLAQKKYSAVIKDRVDAKKRAHYAAVCMQKVCRGFIVRQRYWFILGCTMQVQSWMRGRLVKLRIQREASARLKLQCFSRRCLARQEYLQRKFILALLKTADQEKAKRVAGRVIQEKARDFVDDRTRDQAARTIQRFFLMVKREVDQMVRATKKRKNWRNKMKKSRNDQVEDALLEDAWGCFDHVSISGLESLPQSSSHGSSGHNENIRINSQKTVSVPIKQVRNVKRDPFTDLKPKLPPRYYDMRVSQPDDDKTEFSGVTMSTATFSRISLSRMKRREPRDLDEDLELEEAFMDYEISARQDRRMPTT